MAEGCQPEVGMMPEGVLKYKEEMLIVMMGMKLDGLGNVCWIRLVRLRDQAQA